MKSEGKPKLGLVLPIGPVVGPPGQFVDRTDRLIGLLGARVRDLWVTDHLQWDADATFEAWTTLAFAAARWPRLDLGTMVLSQGYRNVGLLSKMVTTLQTLAQRTITLGIGAGWKQDEYDAFGYDFPSGRQRVDELDEALQLLVSSWSVEGRVSLTGSHHRAVNASFQPLPQTKPIVLIGGGGSRTLELVAKYAAFWNLPDCPLDVYENRRDQLRAACEVLGRDVDDIRLGWFGRLVVAESEQHARAIGSGVWSSRNALVGTPSQVREQIAGFVDVGVDHFALEILGVDPASNELPESLEAVLQDFAEE